MGYINMNGKKFKIIPRRRAQLQANGKIKRTGDKYFEIIYWTGNAWTYLDFITTDAANNFLTMKGLK